MSASGKNAVIAHIRCVDGFEQDVWVELGDPATRADGNLVWDFQCRVRFYLAPEITDLWDQFTRFLFFMQLRDDVVQQKISVPEDMAHKLAGFAAHALLGEYSEEKHTGRYLGQVELLPGQDYAMELIIERHHKHCQSMTAEDAELAYIHLVQGLPHYGIEFYPCSTPDGKRVSTALSGDGFAVYVRKELVSILPWADVRSVQNVGKVVHVCEHHDGRKDVKHSFKFDHKTDCKTMWNSAVCHHAFYRRRSKALLPRPSVFERAFSPDAAPSPPVQAASITFAAPAPLARRASAVINPDGIGSILANTLNGSDSEASSHRGSKESVVPPLPNRGSGASNGSNEQPPRQPRMSTASMTRFGQRRRTSWVTELSTGQAALRMVMEEVVLEVREGEPLGISITGGSDNETNPSDHAIYVNDLISGGMAEADGRLRQGDRLCSINGESMDSVEHCEAIALFRRAALSGKVVLLVSRFVQLGDITREQEFNSRHGVLRESHIRHRQPQWQPGTLGPTLEENTFVVDIVRGMDGFGLDLIGTNNNQPGGVFISGVRAGSAAAKKNAICRGLQVLEVNGWHVGRARLDEVTRLFAKEPDRITITLCANPEVFAGLADLSLRLHYLPLNHTFEAPRYVTLVRDDEKGFGLNLIGPATGDDALKCRGVFVKAVLEDSTAFLDDLVQPGDRILEINGWSTRDVSQFAVAETLRQLKQPARLMVTYSPEGMAALWASVEELDVSAKMATEGLEYRQIEIGGGDFLCIDLVSADDGEGMFVARSWGSAAAKGIHTGDQILEVDDVRTHVSKQIRVARLLRGAKTICIGSNAARLSACYQRSQYTYTLAVEKNAASHYGFEAIASSKGLQVIRISKTGPLAGRLAKGDEILEINGCSLRGLTFNEALEVLNKTGDVAFLNVYHNNFAQAEPLSPLPHEALLRQNSVTGYGTKMVKLQRKPDEPLGFGIGARRARDGSACGGVVIAAIVPSTPAARASSLCVGDQLVRINGKDMRTATVEETKTALMGCKERCMLELVDYSKLIIETSGLRIMAFTLKRTSASHPWGIEFAFEQGSFVITHIVADSPAQAVHCLNVRDELLSIGLTSLAPLSESDVSHILEKGELELLITIVSRSSIWKEEEGATKLTHTGLQLIELSACQAAKSLGFSLTGFSAAAKGLQKSGVYVKDPEPWVKELGLEDGDQLIEISGARPNEWLPVRLEAVEFVQAELQQALSSSESLWVVVLPRTPVYYTHHQGSSSSLDAPNDVGRLAYTSKMASVTDSNRSAPTPSAPNSVLPVLAPKKRRASSAYPPTPVEVNAPPALASPRPSTHDVAVDQAKAHTPQVPFLVRACFSIEDFRHPHSSWLDFSKRDILEVVDVSQEDVWFARHHGIIEVKPIPSYTAVMREIDEQMKDPHTRRIWVAYSLVMQRFHLTAQGTFEPPRPVAIVGAEAARIAKVIQLLPSVLKAFPLVHPVPHTTRPPRDGEVNGRDYHFVSQEEFASLLERKLFIEAGQFKDNLYGTSVMAIRDPGLRGNIVLLDTQPRVLSRLLPFSLQPLVVFLQPADATAVSSLLEPDLATPDRVEAILQQSQALELEYGHLFSHIVDCGSSVAETVRSVAAVLQQHLYSNYWFQIAYEFPVGPTHHQQNGGQDGAHPAWSDDERKPVPQPMSTQDNKPPVKRPSVPTSTTTDQADDANIPIFTPSVVTLDRNAMGSFGFSVTGGVESDILPSIIIKSQGITPICVQGTLHQGDELLSVNGKLVADLRHDQVIDLIKSTQGRLSLLTLSYRGDHAANATPAVKTKAVKARDVLVPTRPMREGECDGQEYHFVTVEQFEELERQDQLLQWGKHDGHFYGVLRASSPELQQTRCRLSVDMDHLEGGKRCLRTKTFRSAMRYKDRIGTRVNTVVFNPTQAGLVLGCATDAALPFLEAFNGDSIQHFSCGQPHEGDSVLVVDRKLCTASNWASLLAEATMHPTCTLVLLSPGVHVAPGPVPSTTSRPRINLRTSTNSLLRS